MIRVLAQRRIKMSSENEKLLAVQKSCKGVKIVSLVLLIITVVATVVCLTMAIVMTACSDKIDPKIMEAEDEGYVSTDVMINGMKVGYVDVNPENWHSDVPAIQQKFDEGSLSFVMGIYLFFIFASLLFLDVVLFLFYTVFSIIVKEGTPFSSKVIRRLLISLIFVDVLLGVTAGWAFAILGGFVTWAVITIMEYGKQLQIQSDETL